jgi:HK97 gp10 family phage protein
MTGMEIDGSDFLRLSASFAQGAANVGKDAQVVLRKTTLDVEADAKRRVAVDTGNLKSSIGHSDLRSVGQSGTLESEVGPTADYGVYLELGTSRAAPQPFLGPALDKHAPAFERAMEILAERAANGGT